MERLPLQQLAPLRVGRNDIWNILRKLSNEEPPVVLQKSNKWRVSYVSGNSFTQNKQGFPYLQSTSTTNSLIESQHRFLNSHCSASIIRNGTQIRHFKTDRSTEADLMRNPTMGGRFKKWLGLPLSVSRLCLSFMQINFDRCIVFILSIDVVGFQISTE